MRRLLLSLGTLVLLASPAAAAGVVLDRPTGEVEVVSDLPYVEGDGAHPTKHKLDLYLPRGVKNFPVLFFVHGGAWVSGDRNYFGIYSSLGKRFARQGVGAVVISYRLSPAVKHPEHIRDVARAFAWTHKNIGKYGGRADRIFVCGHSAGGHLSALLATDERYLKEVGLSLKAIRGAMPISGVYQIPPRTMTGIFGDDPEKHREASPLQQVKSGLPPFLILYADGDFPGCGPTSERFCKALRSEKVEAASLELKQRSHLNIITKASGDDDPTAAALLDFIVKHAE